MPPVRILVVGGRDRLRFLQALLAQDLAGLVPGNAVYGALTDDRGRPISDYHLYVLPEAVLLELPEGRAEAARAALESRIIADDVRTAWAAGEVVAYEAFDPMMLVSALLGLLPGPGPDRIQAATASILNTLRGVGYSAADGFAEDAAELEDEAVLATVPAVRRAVLHASRLGGDGFLTWASWDQVTASTDPEKWGRPVPVTATQVDSLEIAAGRIAAPELAAARVWNELGLMAAVSLGKGCWMGQEIVRRVHTLGETKRILRGLALDVPDGVGWAGAKLEDATGAAVGVVTRAARIPVPDLTAALAFVPREAGPGTPLVAVRADGTRAAATVHALPFVGRLDHRPAPVWIPTETA